MASFERRFLTIKVTKFASTEAEVLVITMVIPEIIGMYIFIYGLLFAYFVTIFVAQVLSGPHNCNETKIKVK